MSLQTRIERLVARFLIANWRKKHPPRDTPALARAQRDELAALINAAGDSATTRVQIKRLPGLETSSTHWSLGMVARHLAMTNRDMATTIASLARGEQPTIEVIIANYKPSPDTQPADALAELNAALDQLDQALADPPAVAAATRTHTHPWFGPLTCETWAIFPTFHQHLHLKQARLIAKGLPPA